jgi:hypothetical protein
MSFNRITFLLTSLPQSPKFSHYAKVTGDLTRAGSLQVYYSMNKESVAKDGPFFQLWQRDFQDLRKLYLILNHHEAAIYLSRGFFYAKDEKAPCREHGLPLLKYNLPKEIPY